MGVVIFIVVFVIIVLWVPSLLNKWFSTTREGEYERGYKNAMELINKGRNPQELYEQSFQSLDFDAYDKGWQTACLGNGAVDNY